MPKRSSKPPTDPARAAYEAVQKLTDPQREKNPAAVALGRLGGQKGGKARAESLSAKRRAEIAKKAAKKRWENARKGANGPPPDETL